MDPAHIPKVKVERLLEKEGCEEGHGGKSEFDSPGVEDIIVELVRERDELLQRVRGETDGVEAQKVADMQVFQYVLHNVMVAATGDDVAGLLQAEYPGMDDLSKYLAELSEANFETHQQISHHYKRLHEEYMREMDLAVQDLGSATPIPSPREGRASFRIDFPEPKEIPVFRSPSVTQTPRDVAMAETPRMHAETVDDFDPQEQLSAAYDMQGRLLLNELQQHLGVKMELKKMLSDNTTLYQRVQELEKELLEKDEKMMNCRAELDAERNTVADLRLEAETGRGKADEDLRKEFEEAKRHWKRREARLRNEYHTMQTSLEAEITALLSHPALSSTPTTSPGKQDSIWAPQKKPSNHLASSLENLRTSLQNRAL